MKDRKLIGKKMKPFYEDVKQKRKNRKVCLQTDQQFLQNEIKNTTLSHII